MRPDGQAILARRDGDTFQSRQFWRKACCLLDPESPVVRVGFEGGPKGFDDIGSTMSQRAGFRIKTGRHSCASISSASGMWRRTPMAMPSSSIPNSSTPMPFRCCSGCERPERVRGNDKGARYRLLSNWRISPSDPLRQLVHQRSHTLRLDLLYSTATERSAMGAIRKLWMDHLGLDENELREMLHTLAISEATDPSMTHVMRLILCFGSLA